ncbi:MAG: isoamylase early set domain-containing protein [Elusimicrobia bacterium]|nr:isoamylase early set domain-containing protein [Elusimicrobiota bacterium]
MQERSKWAFWIMVSAALLIVCVPSAVLLDAVRRYERFLEGFEASPLRPVRMRGTPHREGRGADVESKLEFVDFRLSSPKAAKVSLVGDFNAWKAGTLPMAKMPGGSWELTLPLPPGRYRYRFVVDDEEILDPEGKETDEVSGKSASVRMIP